MCFNKFNELDDKVVWTTMLELETNGIKSESCHVRKFMRKGREAGGKNNDNKEKLKWYGGRRMFEPDIDQIS